MNGKGTTAVIAVLGAAMLGMLAGCGGGGSTATVTKAEFVKRGNRICEQGRREIEARFRKTNNRLRASGKKVSKAEQEKGLVRVFAAPYEAEIEALRELPPPEGEEEALATVVEAMEGALRKVKAEPHALANSSKHFAQVNAASSGLGLTECVL